jgi:uncharacterized membrane protein
MNFVFILGVESPANYDWHNPIIENLLPFTPFAKTVVMVFLACFYVLIFWVNQRALHQEIKPVLASIEDMQQKIGHA